MDKRTLVQARAFFFFILEKKVPFSEKAAARKEKKAAFGKSSCAQGKEPRARERLRGGESKGLLR